jgi:hypothetical protein
MAFLDSQLHINVPLTDYAVAFRPEENQYLWNTLLPQKPVRHRSDLIRQISKANLLRRQDLRVGKGGRVTEVQFKLDPNLSYNAVDYAASAILRETERMNADDILQYDQEMMYTALIYMHTNLEVLTIKETLRDPTILTNNVTLTAPHFWDNYLSPVSDPLNDIRTGVNQVRTKTGYYPNCIVMHELVWDKIQRHPRLLARGPVHPYGSGIVTKQAFELMLGVEPGTLKVTAQQYNVALEDQPGDFRSMTGPDVIIAYTTAPSIRTYGLGSSFMFQGDGVRRGEGGDLNPLPELGAPFVVYQFPNYQADPRGAQSLNLIGALDQRVLNAEAGYLIKSCVDATNTAVYGNFLNN